MVFLFCFIWTLSNIFYFINFDPLQAAGPASSFLSSALLYLTYNPINSTESQALANLSVEMIVAAIIGEKVFNVGELVW